MRRASLAGMLMSMARAPLDAHDAHASMVSSIAIFFISDGILYEGRKKNAGSVEAPFKYL